MKAIFSLQPDDRNHLIIETQEGKKLYDLYVRPSLWQFGKLLKGSADFAEYGAYSEESKEAFRKVAKLFKEGKIRTVVITNYAFVKPDFKVEASPKKVKIQSHGLGGVIEVTKGRKKVVIIVQALKGKITVYEV